MEKKLKLLFNTSGWLDDVNDKGVYADYVDECRERGKTPAAMDSDEFTGWCIDLERENMADDLDNIRCSKALQGPWLITGTLGLWDGRHTICPVIEPSLDKAIRRCSEDDTKVEYDRGAVYVSASHHDGTNVFVIRKLSGEAVRLVETEGEDALLGDSGAAIPRDYFEKLPEYLF